MIVLFVSCRRRRRRRRRYRDTHLYQRFVKRSLITRPLRKIVFRSCQIADEDASAN
jgi:hypothetical protein